MLTRLERIEERLLAWGLPDVACDQQELEKLVRVQLPGASAQEVIRELGRRGWIRPLGSGRYRSRAAETVRLLARLRQMFDESQWETGLPLVADFRYHSSPRMVPGRTLDAAHVLQHLSTNLRRRWGVDDSVPAVLKERKLSAFQARALNDLLTHADTGRDGAAIVTAGTGAGKTLCFYLPALVARTADKDHKEGPYILAIYPRVELLRDQMRAAVEELQRFKGVAKKSLGRPLSLGAYYGDTPTNAQYLPPDGVWECPYMMCWACDAKLVWRRRGQDWSNSPEQLVCSRGCGMHLGEDEVRLTRKSLTDRPPDIIFTTMESLNNLLQNTWNGQCVGLTGARPPRFVLLDEVHAYGGITGAQHALVLRRWRHAARQKGHAVQFVGLSATIKEPKPFLSLLTGVPESMVRQVAPQPDEMKEESRRYNVVLRGDPISAAALLSTSIQALMLMSRMVDPPSGKGEGRASLFGRKVFAFCDTLDVHRRLADDLADAELRRLPALRASRTDEDVATRQRRDDLGQLWALSEDVGHRLQNPIRVDDVSSLSPGVRPDADVVIATASLELGFDDPDVGVVLQHKAPHDAASFLQRMGRAGRQPHMRPWAVCVLSDFGRDRMAYAAYEDLFDPVLTRRALPVNNRYILRIQAGYSLCDWLAREVARGKAQCKMNSVGKVIASKEAGSQKTRAALSTELKRLVDSDEARVWLVEHLKRALRQDESVVLDLMWQSPRGLMTEMVPAMLRMLEDGSSSIEAESPLDAYLPGSLFARLNLPEVQVPVAGREKPHALTIGLALREFTAGRVNRRFGGRGDGQPGSHWVAPQAWRSILHVREGQVELRLSEVAGEGGLEELGTWDYLEGGEVQAVSVFFPLRLAVRGVPQDVLPSSTAVPMWRSQVVCRRDSRWLRTPSGSALHGVLPHLDFLLHADNRSVTVRRFTTGSEGTIAGNAHGERKEAYVRVEYRHPSHPDQPAALGWQAEVDGLALGLEVPPAVRGGWEALGTAEGRARRVEFYRGRVVADFRQRASQGGQRLSTFLVDRLLDLFLAGLAARAIVRSDMAGSVADARSHENFKRLMKRTQEVMLRSIEAIEGEAETMGRLGERIEPLASAPDVHEVMVLHAGILHEPFEGASWRQAYLDWMNERTRRALAEAVLEAASSLLPDFDASDLVVDLQSGAGVVREEVSHPGCCWITEAEPGGTGTLEALRTCYAEDPDRFMSVLAESIRGSADDRASDDLGDVLGLLVEDPVMKGLAAGCRKAGNLQEAEAAARSLETQLESRGIVVGHALRASIFLRFLRPGSSFATDLVTHRIHTLYGQLRERLGIEVDSRCVAYVATKDPGIAGLIDVAWPGTHSEAWKFNQVYSLLWPSTRSLRLQRFQSWQPFLQSAPADPDALVPAIPTHPRVEISSSDWFEQLGRCFAERETRVDLVAGRDHRAALKAALLRLALDAHEVQALRLHAEIEYLERDREGGWVATVRIPDVFA
ncbi:MAG: DEAD/DEAH box helicase [Planctomycetes bacterium]|nr:DEAD/DEAH box helicase [Planctomycetota bacterium]